MTAIFPSDTKASRRTFCWREETPRESVFAIRQTVDEPLWKMCLRFNLT